MKGWIEMKENEITVIIPERTNDFLEELNKNQISDDFLSFCKKVEELFEEHKDNL